MRFPQTVRHRRESARIYGPTAGNPRYRVAYYAAGRRTVRQFKTYSKAKVEAERIVRQLAAGNDAALSLSPRDERSLRFCQEELRRLNDKLKGDIDLKNALVEYSEAKRLLGSTRLAEAVKSFLATSATVRRAPLRQAIDEYLAERRQHTKPEKGRDRPALSPKVHYLESLRLEKLASTIQNTDVADLTKDHLDCFFGETLRGLGAKARNHCRSTLKQFIGFCVAKSYLPPHHTLLSAVGMRKQSHDAGRIEVYTPKEFSALLVHSDGHLQLLIGIGGLAGLRTAELLRLEWSNILHDRGFIEVTADQAKTRKRRLVPICPALAAWLAPYRSMNRGRIWPYVENNFHVRYRQCAASAQVARKDNGLRHGFISYRLAQTQNENTVAQEAGTSPTMIYRHYRELVRPDEAAAWFSIMPENAAKNVVEMPKIAR